MSRVQFAAGNLGVVFFATGRGWVLKCISFYTRIYLTLKNLSVDNECKCQILSLIYPVTKGSLVLLVESNISIDLKHFEKSKLRRMPATRNIPL